MALNFIGQRLNETRKQLEGFDKNKQNYRSDNKFNNHFAGTGFIIRNACAL